MSSELFLKLAKVKLAGNPDKYARFVYINLCGQNSSMRSSPNAEVPIDFDSRY